MFAEKEIFIDKYAFFCKHRPTWACAKVPHYQSYSPNLPESSQSNSVDQDPLCSAR